MGESNDLIAIPSLVSDMLQKYGLAVDPLFRDLGVGVSAPGPIMMTSTQLKGFLSHLKDTIGPQASLLLGETISFGASGYIALNSLTVREGLAAIMTYVQIDVLTGKVSFYEDEHHVKIRATYDTPNLEFERFSIEVGFSTLASIGKNLLEQPVSPLEVRFTFPAPENIDAYRQAFSCPVLFGQLHNEALYPLSVLDLKLRNPDLALRRFMKDVCERRLNELPDHNPISRWVEEIIQELFDDKLPSMEQVAATMNIPRRTLQRKLSEEGNSFRKICDGYRQQIACHYLENTGLPIEEIAIALGFSDPRGFYLAFKKWTGVSPGKFRQANTALN